MTHAELEAWREFHLVNPIDDHHRIYRPAALMAAAFVSGKDKDNAVQGYLDWLEPKPVIFSDSDKRTLAAFGLKHPRSN